MGNLVTASFSVWSPLLTSELFIPYIYHPLNFVSNIPFKSPSALKYCMWYFFFNSLIVGVLSVIGSIMSSKKECDNYSIYYSILGARIPILMTIIGLTFIFLVPILKVPLLVLLGFLPYSKYIVDGLFLSVFVLFGGIVGNNYVRRKVCTENKTMPMTKFGLNPIFQ